MGNHHALLFTILATLALQVCSSKHDLPHCNTPSARYERVEKYTTSWFMEHVLDTVKARYSTSNNLFHNALFYTRNMSSTAIAYACRADRITIWEPWHPDLYNDSNATANRYSCIHHDAAARNHFFGNMSEAFARLSAGDALVMHSHADYADPPTTGIWGRVERKAIADYRTGVDRVFKMRATDRGSILAVWSSGVGEVAGQMAEYLTARFMRLVPQSKLRRRWVQQVLEDGRGSAPACPRVPEYTLPVDW